MKILRNIVRKPVNFILNYNVDKDVQSMLFPLNLMQNIMFCPKYRIKNDVITPNSLISNFVSMIMVFIIVFLYALSTYITESNRKNPGYNSIVLILSYRIFYSFGFVMNFVIEIIQTKNNVHFVVTFQKVHRFLNKEPRVKFFIIWNWVLGSMALGFYVIFVNLVYILLSIPFYSVSVCYFMIIFDLNIVYVTQLIKLLECKMKLWHSEVLEYHSHEEDFCTKVFQAFVGISDCYNLIKAGFQQFMLFYIILLVEHSLTYTQVAIEISKKDFFNMNEAFLTFLPGLFWLTKDLLWQTRLIHQLEKYYLAVQSVQDTCAIVQKSTCTVEEKKLCRNVLRLHRASFSKIRVCGLFYEDAVLQLSLMSFLTNYTIVLLQFAFL